MADFPATPDRLVAEAHANLTRLGGVLAQGATIAPDFVARALIAMRGRLYRHTPVESWHAGRQVCGWCRPSTTWPCPDVAADFQVLGVAAEED